MKKILITGSGGVLGSVLVGGLSAEITEFDLPKFDVTDFVQLVHMFEGHDCIVHLAWDTKTDNWLTEKLNPDNTLSAYNIYEAAHLAGVPRVIMASSVHADDFVNHKKSGLISPTSLPIPDSPYGANKCFMEALGRYYADAKGLEVVCVRFGGVNRENTVPTSPISEQTVWLSHADAISLVQTCIDAPDIPGKYTIMYGISDNQGRIHDLTNPLGWHPTARA